jgi:DNA-binding SARP family transcriptional activator
VAVDPVAEELYRRLMRLQAELGRPDAVQRTYRLLARQLADLDVDPDPETEQLVADQPRRPGA